MKLSLYYNCVVHFMASVGCVACFGAVSGILLCVIIGLCGILIEVKTQKV